MIDVDKEDIVECIRHAGRVPYEKAETIVDAFVTAGWLDCSDGVYSIHDWDVWQKQWYSALERRRKNTEYQRENRAKKRAEMKEAGQLELELPGKQELETQMEGNKPEGKGSGIAADAPQTNNPVPKKKKAYPPEFRELWNVYPRKDEKAAACNAYLARRHNGYSHEELMTATQNYVLYIRRKHIEPDFIKLGKTFFGPNEPFTDYLPKPKVFETTASATAGNPFADALEGDEQ